MQSHVTMEIKLRMLGSYSYLVLLVVEWTLRRVAARTNREDLYVYIALVQPCSGCTTNWSST
jgi:hypothetical protein